jgi:signal recognition particle GTPase
MASALTDRLSRLVKTMRGQARITEANVQDMLREVRMAWTLLSVMRAWPRIVLTRRLKRSVRFDAMARGATRVGRRRESTLGA